MYSVVDNMFLNSEFCHRISPDLLMAYELIVVSYLDYDVPDKAVKTLQNTYIEHVH